MSDRDYLHGYRTEEQDRLIHQARYLEAMVFAGVDFSHSKKILEVGSGVGAQTAILLERFPQAHLTCVDAEPKQIERAKDFLAKQKDRVDFLLSSAEEISLPPESKDAAFICWFLEHVKDPEKILRRIRPILQPGSPIVAIEVFNPLFRLHPPPPNTVRYFEAFNQLQFSIAGNPEVGLELGALFRRAEYQDVHQETVIETYDGGDVTLRNSRLDYWFEILESAYPAMLQAGRAEKKDLENLRNDLSQLKKNPHSTFLFGFIKVFARA
jgi:ubiquinone/menaquinone biosynthesis C-methylase UbiE